MSKETISEGRDFVVEFKSRVYGSAVAVDSLKIAGDTGKASFYLAPTVPATPSASTDAASKSYVDSAVKFLVAGGGSDAAGIATKYLAQLGSVHSAAQVVLGIVSAARTLQNLYVDLVTAPGGAATYIVTVQKSTDHGATWSDTTLTCTVTGAAKSASDVAHTVAVVAGTLLAIKVVSSAGLAAGATAGIELV